MKPGIAALAALTLTASGLAAFSAVAAAPQAPQAQDESRREKKICRTDKATGSLTRRTRICMTEAQWRELNNRTRRGVDEMNGSASGAPSCISAVDVACGGPSAAGPQGG
jgi:hypothetical protein